MLQFTAEQCKAVEGVAIAQYPQECCGLLLGTQAISKGSGEAIKRVTQVWPTPNAWTPEVEAEHREILGLDSVSAHDHSQGDRFWIDPRDLLKAQMFARSQDWSVIGIYHSHPNHPAVPSERDRQSAWPDYSYLILSVSKTGIADQQSWILDETSQFQPEKIEISP